MKIERVFQRSLQPFHKNICARVQNALEDDLGYGDITTCAILLKPTLHKKTKARVIAKSPGVFAGLLEAKQALNGLKLRVFKKEGQSFRKGEVLLEVSGDARLLLSRGRIALNYLQFLSGVATDAHAFSSKHAGRVASLRKLHPGMHYSEKRAASLGGALTHRLSLADGFLIKDNHLAAVCLELFGKGPWSEKQKTRAVKEALKRVKKYKKKYNLAFPVEIEVESLAQALTAAGCVSTLGLPHAILIDNKTPPQVRRIVNALKKTRAPVLIEASGGITKQNAGAYLKAGADVVSTSRISVWSRPIDLSLQFVGFKPSLA